MITYGGERITLSSGVPLLNTIGVSLGRIVRFCGHTEHWYPVLAHSLVVAAILPREIGIYGLTHDGQECIFSDVPTPMKTQVARNRENVVRARIHHAYGLEWPMSDAITDALEEADSKALLAEAHIANHPGAGDQWGTYYDKEAGRLTEKQLKRAMTYIDPKVSGPTFVKAFKKYAKFAGIEDPGTWQA